MVFGKAFSKLLGKKKRKKKFAGYLFLLGLDGHGTLTILNQF